MLDRDEGCTIADVIHLFEVQKSLPSQSSYLYWFRQPVHPEISTFGNEWLFLYIGLIFVLHFY